MFPSFSNFLSYFLERGVDSGLNGGKAKFAAGGNKAAGSRAGVNLGLADQGPIKYFRII